MHTRIGILITLAGVVSILAAVQAVGAPGEEALQYDVPRLMGIIVDGDSTDWRERGFRVEILPDAGGKVQPKASLDPSFRLGWDERGLLVLVTVRDDFFVEGADAAAFGEKDSVEVFMAAGRGAQQWYGLAISPGMTPEFPELRTEVLNPGEGKPSTPRTYEAARKKLADGYTLEILLPWANLGRALTEGSEASFQLAINDVDASGGRFQAVWYPQAKPRENPKAMARIRLARRPSPPDCARVRGEYDDCARSHVSVLTLGEFSGQAVRVMQGRKQVAGAVLEAADGYARADFRFPMPAGGKTAAAWRVRIGKVCDMPLDLPDAAVARAQRILLLAMAAKPPVFKGETFPACDFADPLLAERLLGPYRIDTQFYDRAFNRVTSASAPGRYGAVFEIRPQSGSPLRRYLTLFRAPDSFDTLFSWWYLDPGLSMRMPDGLGLDPGVAAAQRESLGAYLKGKILDDLYKGQEAAILFAGLFEAQPGQPPASVTNDVWAVDRQWWVDLKRKLNGMEEAYPDPVTCPYQKEGSPAPTLREGTPEEAEMTAEVADKVDAVCRTWVEESREPFGVCLARHGVVFFQKAYGERYGEPMTLTTESWMASISKFLSGTLMMTLVDQSRVDLDTPIDKYLPALRGISVKYPLTIRHLYTHTGGLGLGLQPARKFVDHWGDERNDLEEIVAGYYPYLDVGARHTYNGAGHALGGKIIESVSGEALPQYFKRHLWEPLGCEHTSAMDGSAYTMSTPRDIAVFAQMLLNRGAYGNLRFFSEATFEKMLPVKLAPYVHFDTNLEWGIGPVWTPEPGLSKRTFGHGAASAATLRIDPDNDLIIVMTRNTAGPAWGKYHPQFIQAIVDGILK
jgi:CubicO group peptidase (beta-lactamase class C family)